MWAGDLSPDDADLGATDLSLRAVDEGNLLTEVEAVTGQRQFSSPVPTVSTYLAALVSSTPSILIKLVPGVVMRLPRW